jgi:hypothetical protein
VTREFTLLVVAALCCLPAISIAASDDPKEIERLRTADIGLSPDPTRLLIDFPFYWLGMWRSRASVKRKATRSWGVVLIRGRGQLLGYVQAPDLKAAEAAAVRQFNLSEEQRRRLLIRERL